MTPEEHEQRDRNGAIWINRRLTTIVLLLTILGALVGFARPIGASLGFMTERAHTRDHDADMAEIRQMFDTLRADIAALEKNQTCWFFDAPKDCRDDLTPR